MDSQADFDVNEAIKNYDNDPLEIATPDASRELQDFEHEPERLGEELPLLNAELNPIVDAIAGSPEAILRSANFDTLQFLLKFSAHIPAVTLGKVLDLVGSALAAQVDVVHADIQAQDQDALKLHKTLLEMYGFLLRWTISAVESREALEKPTASAPAARGKKGAKSKTAKDGVWDASAQLEAALDRISKVLRLELGRIFVTTSERDTFIGLLTKPIYHILENSEKTGRIKNTAIRNHSFRVLAMAVRNHGHAYNAQISITQALFFYSHLSEAMAELLHIVAKEYNYPQLTEEVLREVSDKEFSSTDKKGPTSVSAFLVRISELLPEVVMKQMTSLAKLVDNESYTLRMAMIDVCGQMVIMISKLTDDDQRGEVAKPKMDTFLDELEQRFLDINPYCRARVMQVYVKLCDLEARLSKRRKKAAKYAAQSLMDKSSNVRRNAIKLISKLVETHPFTDDGGLLSKEKTERELGDIDTRINALVPAEPEKPASGEQTLDEEMLQDATQVESAAPEQPKHPDEMTEAEKIAIMKKLADAQELEQLQTRRKYYNEKLRFIEVVDDAADDVMQLLSAKNKSEVIEAMDFFVKIYAYKIPNARNGVRRMLRLIWTKGNSDEGKGVQTHLIECYKDLFFVANPLFDRDHSDDYIMHNMITLTYGTSPAELTSLEQLLSMMMKQGMIKETVVQKLWATYAYQKKAISRTMRRGAIIVLGMLALAKPEIIVNEMELCLRIGLGELGRRDLALARYTCIALRRISPPPGKQSESGPAQVAKLPNDHAVLVKLATICEIVSDDKEWFGVAEQAISAIYVLSKHPDVLCSEILRRKIKHVFAPQAPSRPTSSGSGAEDAMDVDAPMTPPPDESSQPKKQNPALALSQLLFIVGHIAIKQIVHLELCELEIKRRKAEKGTKKAPTPRQSLAAENPSPVKKGRKKSSAKAQTPAAEEVDELELMAGPSEDDITDHIAHIRERQLLYGPDSLLANFGPLVRDICFNSTSYNHPTLLAQAALCLAKLMCVSSEYCEKNLELLLTMMERSKDPVVRSNLVIALADMAVCFNHLIDENESHLYRRLNDGDPSVKRTCLMTLTFLILAGQVKVKSELAKMAKCMEDSDDKIKDMARMFFTELATKDNAIYNQFIDMFSTLSADTGLNEDAFKKIIKTLAGYIEKDKHAKVLSKKLAERLPRADNEKEWNDIAFTLGQLQHKDEEITKLVSEGFKVVQASA
ncbi:condensin complex subunit 1 [Paraphaeosphaeria sporulosa]